MAEDFIMDVQDQDKLGNMDVFADIVYCIDITGSMAPSIELVKKTAKTLYKDLQEIMKEKYQRTIKQLRVKIIGFRDFYVDGPYALETSDFFSLPHQVKELEEFINKLEAKGGGDISKNSLEALALAMKSDWCQTADSSIRKRHIIVLFTDASAYPLEKAAETDAECYPKGMPKSFFELIDLWSAQSSLNDGSGVKMDQRAKRMAIFAPEGCEPWDMVADDFDNCLFLPIAFNTGGEDISTDYLLKALYNITQN